ncbi:MAG TPA: hypothetical protein VFV89_12085 [Nocardioides sp.]|uniref:hypothetical protein n=1 Tax=Nocardioides sp. TaxID=35761 RepID=UPI002E34F89F|nr:hypothetical protein [Nocardioides sp.]HEX5088539.1 hypothetical protein [Nocardioides sp.]
MSEETRLREALQMSEIAQPTLRDDQIAALLSSGHARRRRRTNVISLIAVGCAIAVSAGSFSVWRHVGDPSSSPPAAGQTSEHSSGPSTDQTTDPTAVQEPSESEYEWAEALAKGTSTPLVYLAGTTLVTPTGSVSLPGTGAGLVGQTVNGIVVLLESDHTGSGGAFTSKYVIVAPNGHIADLPATKNYTLQNEAISPDRTQIAYGDSVRDARTMELIAPVPAKAVNIISWTPYGIIYSTMESDLYLWDPGSSPVELQANPGVYPSQTLYGFRNDNPCTDIVRLESDGSATRISSGCNDKPFITVSPDGRTAIDNDLGIVDVQSGDSRSFASNGIHDLFAYTSLVWTSDSVFEFPVQGPRVGKNRPTIIVSCDTAALSCVRAGDAVDVPASAEIQLTR